MSTSTRAVQTETARCFTHRAVQIGICLRSLLSPVPGHVFKGLINIFKHLIADV